MKKNDIIKVSINDVTVESVGIGRYENMVVFIPNSMLGEEVEVRIIKLNRNYAIGKIQNIIVASKDRVEPDCPHYFQCGGCSFRHTNYEAELKIKHKHVFDSLTRIGGFKNIKVENIVGAEKLNYYRNKTQIPIGKNIQGKIIAGFFKQHSHNIIDCPKCLLHPEEFNEIINSIKYWIKKYNISIYNEKNNSGIVRHVYLRIAESTKEIMVCLVVKNKNFLHKSELIKTLKDLPYNISSIVLNINSKNTNVILGEKCEILWGKESIKDILCDLKFDVSPLAFYQVNKAQTEKLYKLIQKHFSNSKDLIVVDLYCGIGTITLSIASFVNKAIGVEIIKEAIDNAKSNALNNNIKNVNFICDDAANIIGNLKNLEKNIDVFILDPPRKGCSLELIREILKIDPKNIIYVSCNPATLARDLKIFCEVNFEIESIIPVDMFPRTSHVETVVKLVRKI